MCLNIIINILMLNFISFGSGSSGNAYILYNNNDCIAIDCGVGIRTLKKHFRNVGFELSMIKNILVTHEHADHVKSVGVLSNTYNIPVYSTKTVHNGILGNWTVKKKINPNLVRFLNKGEKINIGSFVVTPFNVPHDSKDCVGYLIEYDNLNFVIVTDCGHITDEIRKYIKIANFLVLEANYEPNLLLNGVYPQHLKERINSPNGHLSNIECGKVIAEESTNNLRYVWLCHLSESNNSPVTARETVEKILQDANIILGQDFDIDVLNRKQPSKIWNLTRLI